MNNRLILNGSPKGMSEKCNSLIYARHFNAAMSHPCDIQAIAGSDLQELAQTASAYDTIIFIFPLYIHAMPGIVKDFMEVLQPAAPGQALGFIVQAGFIESAQHRFLEPYLEHFTEKMGYRYLGTVSKGESAGVYMYPKMFKRLLKRITELGAAFEKSGAFDPALVEALAKPYELSVKQLRILRLVDKLGLANLGWHSVLRKNKAMPHRLDKPFL